MVDQELNRLSEIKRVAPSDSLLEKIERKIENTQKVKPSYLGMAAAIIAVLLVLNFKIWIQKKSAQNAAVQTELYINEVQNQLYYD